MSMEKSGNRSRLGTECFWLVDLEKGFLLLPATYLSVFALFVLWIITLTSSLDSDRFIVLVSVEQRFLPVVSGRL